MIVPCTGSEPDLIQTSVSLKFLELLSLCGDIRNLLSEVTIPTPEVRDVGPVRHEEFC